MIQIGSRWTLKWRHPHRLEAVVTALEPNYVVCEVDHRCPFSCYLQGMRNTLPMEGTMRYSYGDFAELFVPLNADAIALPA